MNDASTSLDRMHDIVVPDPVPWWPPAPGWYAVSGLLLVGGLLIVLRVWKRWRANTYRRAALRELEHATSVSAIAEVLRRTALAASPRSTIAQQTGAEWSNWLEHSSTITMNEQVRTQLAVGPYDPSRTDDDVAELRKFAAAWIARHRLPDRAPASSGRHD